jgi:peptidoglycan/xylan/chitin deacetylase (PgdA/CDA1 family)
MNLLMWQALAAGGVTATLLLRSLRGRAALLVLPSIVFGSLIIWLATSEAAAAALIAVTGFGALAASRLARSSRASNRRRAAVAALGAFPGLVCFAALGATLPQATWFGSAVSHGPRFGNAVAITFDDGPNGEYTLAVMHALDAAGVKATFFQVGKAAKAQPDVVQQLVTDGQLIANHSYSHGRWDWLVPGYPEAARAEKALYAAGGVCPAFYRPPHGERSPLTVRAVRSDGLTTVTWDVSAGDWATDDPDLVAKRILQSVKPGSIILLHDGLDGKPGADRSVVVEALPLILDGLRERDLQPVRLDQLLGRPAYRANC